MKTRIVSDCLLRNIDDIKLAALYFDEVEIIRRVHVDRMTVEPVPSEKTVKIKGEFHDFVSRELLDHLQILVGEGIVTVSTSQGRKFFEERGVRKSLHAEAKGLVLANIGSVFPTLPFSPSSATSVSFDIPADYQLIGSEEAEALYASPELRKIGRHKYEAVNKLTYLLEYYTDLLEELLFSLSNGKPCLTASSTLHRLLAAYGTSEKFASMSKAFEKRTGRNPTVAIEALKCALPDLSHVSVEDLLEFRQRAADELDRFRIYVEGLSTTVTLGDDPVQAMLHAKSVVSQQIEPALENLTRKIEGLKTGLMRSALRSLRDPKANVPFFLNALFDVPGHLLVLLGLGIAGLDTVLEHYQQLGDIRRNGLYYLIKARRNLQTS